MDGNWNMKKSCNRFLCANACGHVFGFDFAFCGGKHRNGRKENEKCYKKSKPKKNLPEIVVTIGNTHCSRACRAVNVGWNCCTCGYEYVFGWPDSDTGMVTHKHPNGQTHAFCFTCEDAKLDTHEHGQPHASEMSNHCSKGVPDEDSNVIQPLFANKRSGAPPIPQKHKDTPARLTAMLNKRSDAHRSRNRNGFSNGYAH